jgi:hypothetical protein
MKAPSHTLCLALAAVWLACATTAQAQERIPIVTTTTDLRSLTEAVGGDRVAVTSLVPPNMDAEEYQPKPQDVLRLRAARLLVRVGLDYDLWLDRLLLQAGRREIIRGASGYVDASLRTLDFSPAERATFAGACAERYRVEAEQLNDAERRKRTEGEALDDFAVARISSCLKSCGEMHKGEQLVMARCARGRASGSAGSITRSLNDLVRPLQQLRWDCHTNFASRFEIEDQLAPRDHLDRQFACLGPFENLVNVSRHAWHRVKDAGSIGVRARVRERIRWVAGFGLFMIALLLAPVPWRRLVRRVG